MVKRLLTFTMLELENDMYGQRGRRGGAQRGEQADRQNGENFALDVGENIENTEARRQKEERHVLKQKIGGVFYVVQLDSAADEQREQQRKTEHIAGEGAVQQGGDQIAADAAREQQSELFEIFHGGCLFLIRDIPAS